MSAGLHPAVAVSAGVILVVSYLYGGYWITSMSDEGVFDVPTVLDSLLEAERAAVPRHGAKVAVAFGGCRDRLASSVDVMRQLDAVCPDSVSNVNELHDVTDLEKTFAYYFKNGASASRATRNASFFAEVERAFTLLPERRVSVGGNAPVMAQRFVSEDVAQVMLGANMSPELRSQVDSRIQVIGAELSDAQQDTHLVLEYETNDVCGNYTAPRANRFIVYSQSGGHHQMTSLVEQFTRQLMQSPPDLLVIGGLRQLLSAESVPAVGPSALTRLSQMLAAARPSMRVHVELSTFAEQSTVRQVIEHVVRHADSLGLNEQELPAVRRHLVNWHGTGDELLTSHGAEDSRPSLASMLDDARTTFRLLRHMTIDEQRHFSRLHVHTLAFQIIATEAKNQLWPNSGAATAKASLTAYRHTCGSAAVDMSRAKLLLRETELISMQLGTAAGQYEVHFTGRHPVACWHEPASESSVDVDVDICVAPVLVCTHVIQTVGGGDNISAAALALQI